MFVICPSCQAAFRVPKDAIPASGRTVRCAACQHEWFTTPETAGKRPEKPKPSLTEVEVMLNAQREAAAAEAEQASHSGWAAMPQANAEPDITDDPRHAASAMVAAADEAEQMQANDEAFEFEQENNEEAPQEEEQTYHVTEEELEAFAGLVSQEELDALPTTSALEALTGEKIEEMPDFDAVFAELEHEEEAHVIPKLRPLRKAAKQAADVQEEKTLLFPVLTKRIAYATAALLVLGIALTLVSHNLEIRHNLPMMERFYSVIGYPSSKGVELIDMKMEKTQLPGKTTYDISGAIINTLQKSVPVPAVRIRLIDEHYNELRRWDFSQEKMMKPNESLPFSAPKLRALSGTEKDAYAFIVDIGNGLEMMLRD
jgi:predicted Zn finger-like uncharacterized protein